MNKEGLCCLFDPFLRLNDFVFCFIIIDVMQTDIEKGDDIFFFLFFYTIHRRCGGLTTGTSEISMLFYHGKSKYKVKCPYRFM